MVIGDGARTCLGFLLVFGILGAAEALRRFARIGPEGTRKFVHVGVGHWILLAVSIRNAGWALVAPIVFVVLNYMSYRQGLFRAMEREQRAGGLGTVYYSVALVVLVALFFRGDTARWPAVAGILAMAWGDGLAAIVGERWGRHAYSLTAGRKTAEGSAAMFAACVVVLVLCRVWTRAPLDPTTIVFVAAVATVLEASSPAGTDNLTVPICTALLAAWMAV